MKYSPTIGLEVFEAMQKSSDENKWVELKGSL